MGRGNELKEFVIGSEEWVESRELAWNWYVNNNPDFKIAWQKAFIRVPYDVEKPIWDCEVDADERIFLRTNGEVYSCALITGSSYSIGNIKDESFKSILEKRNNYAMSNVKGCPAIAYHMLGDPKLEDPRNETSTILHACPREREYWYPRG